jgi:hypothetical protein
MAAWVTMSPLWRHLFNLASSASPLQPHLFSGSCISNGSTSGGGMSHNSTSDGGINDNSMSDGGISDKSMSGGGISDDSTNDGTMSDDVASLTSPVHHPLFNLTSSVQLHQHRQHQWRRRERQ